MGVNLNSFAFSFLSRSADMFEVKFLTLSRLQFGFRLVNLDYV
jgi:hypothetical protein